MTGPLTFKFASARAVSESLRAISILSARKSRSIFASVSLVKTTRPPTVNGPPARSKSAQRRQCRVGEARGINGDVAAAGEGWTRNGSANGDIESDIAVKLF